MTQKKKDGDDITEDKGMRKKNAACGACRKLDHMTKTNIHAMKYLEE